MVLQHDGPAPYTSASAMTTVLDAWRERGLTTPIVANTLIRAGVAETIARRTHQSMVILGLIDEQGEPSDQFKEFRSARGDDEYRARFQEWLRAVYADVLTYADPSQDGPQKVAEAFRGYEPEGQRKAMASLLIGLWAHAGLEVADSAPQPPKRNGGAPKRSTSGRSARVTQPAKDRDREVRAKLDGLPPSLVGVFHEIPRNGEGWTEERRDEFITLFKAVLSYAIPIVETDDSLVEPGGDDG